MMNKHDTQKNGVILLFILTAVFALAACGASSGAPAPTASSSSPSTGYANESYDMQGASGGGFSSGEKTASADNAFPADRKVIRNASLEIMAQDAAGLYGSIVEYGTSIGGYEHSYSLANYESYSVINAEFKVPPERLGLFISFIGDRGNVVNSTMNSEDITENYFDASIRLDSKRRSLEQYYQLLMKATGVEEIVYIQRIIDGITEDIESLEGRLSLWNSQVSMATVSLYIRQNNDPIQIRKEISWNALSLDDMGYLIKRGFISITNTIVSLVQWILVILIGYSPLWILVSAGGFLWIMRKRKIRAKKESDPENRNETKL